MLANMWPVIFTAIAIGAFSIAMSLKLEKDTFDELDFDMSKFKVKELLGSGHIVTEIVLDFINRNDRSMNLKNFDVYLLYNGMQFARITKEDIEIKPSSVTQVPISVVISTPALLNTLKTVVTGIKSNKQINVTMKGSVDYISSTFGATVPIEINETYDVYQLILESLNLQDIAIFN